MNRPVYSAITNLVLLAVIAGGFIAYLNRYAISDWWFLRSYHPPARIAQLASEADMTTAGRNMFYRAAPVILTKRTDMLSACSLPDKQVAELGCYLSTEHIYLLSITEPALQNETIVTAAYEMLHPVYQRLNTSQRKRLDTELEGVASHITDPSILDQIQIYAQTEPGERDDELYSILGTEYPTITPALAANYAKYLANRQLLVSYHQQFEQAFNGLNSEITELQSQIDTTKAIMQRYQSNNQIESYNTLVPQINAKIDQYNSDIQIYNRYGQDILGEESGANTQ